VSQEDDIKEVDWQQAVADDWEGTCCVCGLAMSVEDFRNEAGAAVVEEGRVVVACHAAHVAAGGDEYKKAVRLMAEGVVRDWRERNKGGPPRLPEGKTT
jgi:hypothetical protein